MSVALCNGRILLESGFVTGHAVLVEGTRIGAVVPEGDARLNGAARHDLRGRCLLPGFIDSQVNGGGGVLFNDSPTLAGLRAIAAAHRRFGTTGFLPTLISDDVDVMRAAVGAVAQALREGLPGVLGIHLEGPFLAPERKGVHDAAKFRLPDEELLDLVASLGSGRTLLTLAPERVAPDTIRELARRGVIVSLGHTAATYATTRAALDAGARGFTHLYNAMSPLQSREPGVVGAALEDAHSWCGLIVDGEHAHPAAMRVALAAKARGRMMLVTDAMPPVGSAESSFVLDGERIEVRGGVLRNAAGALAGSCLDMASAVRNAVRMLAVPLEEAARMASTYPAAFLRLERAHGAIAAGRRADFVVTDDAVTVHEVWMGGAPVP
ncbi:MAG TPA: N-acetylglucosamine-6-phosphate deacetylase [Steroidobacteraceae bacterium]|nr:N-acetylglucosamine-6-phosphate deacetylase [Steroidobacteraceae bacterium]